MDNREGHAAMIRTAIIVDIDNTILNNDRRKQEILSQKIDKKVGLEELQKDYDIAHILVNGKLRREFWDAFFGPGFLEFDEPVKFAASVLSDVHEKFDIVYLTGRHHGETSRDSMKEGTLASLKKYGFPIESPGTEIYFKDKRETRDDIFKKTVIRSLLTRKQIVLGICDTYDDANLYSSFNIQPIVIRTPYFSDETFINGISRRPIIVNDWLEVKDVIRRFGEQSFESEQIPF